MSGLTTVTSFSKEGYALYGRRFLETYYEYWPSSIPLLIYHEGEFEFGFNLLEESKACALFLERHENDELAKGRAINLPNPWKENDKRNGYNFRYDAFKFMRKVFAIEEAANRIKQGLLFWLDADILTYKTVTEVFLRECLPSDKDVCYLGRTNKHSECGFVGYNLDHPEVMKAIHYFSELYRTDQVFTLHEWHDSYVFDLCRQEFKLKGHNLSTLDRGHVFSSSCLGRYMEHLKGNRKMKGVAYLNAG